MNKPKSKAEQSPSAIRLDDMKAPMQAEAMKRDRSLNWLVRQACKEFLERLSKKKSTSKPEGD